MTRLSMDAARGGKDGRLHAARHWSGSWIELLLLIAFATLGTAEEAPKRVLILNPYSRDVEPFSSAVSSFRSSLARELSEPVDFQEIPNPVRAFVLDSEAIVDVDTTGAESFHEVLSLMAEHKITFALSRANKPFIELLKNYHMLDQIGADQIYPTNRHAVAALRNNNPGE
jgi:hypothetical protein